MKTRNLKTVITIIFLATISPIYTFANSLEPVGQMSIFDVMNYSETLEITIEADFTTLNANRKTVEYLPGIISFQDKNDISQNWNIKVRPRGKYRRRICEMPPLKLKFKKDDLSTAGLARDFNDIKLVTHCTESRAESRKLLAKEFLAYELYRELTPNSFRVQLVTINYIDSNSGKKSKNYGFIIEDKNQLAARIGGEEVDNYGMTGIEFPKSQEKIMAVFQYMIGNEDWNVSMSKNLKFFKKGESIIPVPYDFDFAGLVNASYAKPNQNYGLKSIQERTFMGIHNSDAELRSTRAYFKSKKEDLYKIVANMNFLSRRSKEEVAYYLDTFYDDLYSFNSKERQVQREGSSSTPRFSK